MCRGACVLFVFFYKQKTAYEVRISDWSSDVCSSDLDSERAGPPGDAAGLGQAGDLLADVGSDHQRPGARLQQQAQLASGRSAAANHQAAAGCELGRASRRERVCQYV